MATMEVADSHMIENSTMTPSSHADIDMAGDYYDEEYTMHDAQPTAEVVDDEEIYDAEIEELAGHTEVEMDEYTDELADDNETNMGTYVLPDDATVTDITVESVHLPSSPIGTPRVELAHSPAAHTISPHVVPGPDLSINETAPADALSNHSPRSATTLVDDSEVIPLVNENEKVNPSLHEVTQLTSTDNQTHLATTDSAIDLSTNESAQTTSETEPELYEDELPTVTNSPVPNPSTTDQPPESEGHHGSSATSGEPVAEDPEPFEQRSAHLDDDESHSPIEDALVLNQQVRDDAADSMEPSPPVRLDYDDKVNNVLKSFNIFAPIDPTASEDVELLFGDNRTLFYEPLSVFFTVLRETDYFLHEEWQDAEMELTINLGRYQLSITEDNKQTDDVSLFKLFFIWSGLGLESPLSLTLQRHPGRFSIRYARLLNHLEQRDLQVEDDEHEDKHHGREVDEANQDEEQGSHTAEDNQQVSAEPHDVKNAYNLVHDARAHVEHEVSENAGLDAATTEHLKPEGNQQSTENMPENENEFPHNPDTKHTGKVDTLAEANIPVPPSPVNLDPENNDDLYDDEDYRYIDTGDLPTDDPEQRGEHHPLQDTNEQDEYIEATNLAPESEEPNGVVVEGSEGLDSYYEDYEAGEDSAEEATQGTTSAELEVVSSTSETALLQNSARHPSLKRNLEDLDDNSQQTAALSAPESLFDVKRAKRV